MELYQIRYFLAVTDTLNFTRASERCFVSQSALTKAIQRLEEAMGGRLFDRASNAVHLTDLGRAMLPNFRQIFETANQTREQARRLTREQKELVRIGVMCTIDFDLILPAFVKCRDCSLAIDMSFKDGNLEALTEALDRSDIDLGVMASPYEIPKRFQVRPLFRERYVVAIGDDHRFNGRQSVEMSELSKERYCERIQCEFSSHIDRLMADRDVDVDVVQQSPREDWIQALVRSNFGIAFMPESIARDAGLSFVYTADCRIEREVSVLFQADRTITPAQQTIVDSLTAHSHSLAETV
jgi:LysR family hydrogen peroxide-inducible transcriptional activator